jgi:hypothetical protein
MDKRYEDFHERLSTTPKKICFTDDEKNISKVSQKSEIKSKPFNIVPK